MERVVLGIAGMSCSHCVASVRKALERVPGSEVREVKVGSAAVDFDSRLTSLEQIRNAVTDAGYEVSSTTAA